MKKNRLLSLFLALVMLFGVVSALGGAASAADAPQAWWDGLYIKWELVPGKTVYNIVGYYSVPGVIAQQRAFDDIVFVNENRVFCPSAQNYARIISVMDGIVTFQATNSFANYYNIITDSTQLKLWFTLSAGTGVSDGVLSNYTQQSDEFTSEKVTGTQVLHGYGSPTALTGKVTISPSEPYEGQTLTANLSGAAASIPANKIHYQWQQDMSEDGGFWRDIAGETNKTMTAGSVETKYRVKVTADGYGGSLTSDYVRVVEGQPPLTGTVTVTPSSPKAGDTLTADFTGILATLPAYKLHYQWQRGADVGSSVFEDIPGATSRDYKPIQDDAGKKHRLAVSADGYDGYVISNVVTVASLPALTGWVTVTPENPKPGETLTSHIYGALRSISAEKLHFQWQRYEKVTGVKWGYRDIYGATGNTYSGDEPAGTQIRVKITADGYDGAVYSELVTYASGGSSYQKGDVNMDKTLDNADLILVARYVVNLYNFGSEAFKLGDMDNSGAIDNSDLIRLARLLVGLS